MDLKEKNCAYWIGVLLVVLVLGAIAGFLIGWSWDKRSGALRDVRVLDVLSAIGTISAAVVALYFGLRAQLKEANRIELKRQIFRAELKVRVEIAKEKVILIKGAYAQVAASRGNWSALDPMSRIEQHLEELANLFNNDFLEGFDSLSAKGASKLISEISTIRALKIEFNSFYFLLTQEEEKLIHATNNNREKITHFEKVLNEIF